MSVILDALKKLEREKAAQRSGPVDLVPEITGSRNHGRRTRHWKLAVTIVGAVALTAAVTMAAMTFFTPRDSRSVPPMPERSDIAQPVRRLPVVVEPPPVKEKDKAGDVEDLPIAGKAASGPSGSDLLPRQVEIPSRLPSRETKRGPEAGGNSNSRVGGAPLLPKVSGIAWQESRRDRRAVVNGVLVAEGAIVEGARVERIFQDRVSFSLAGQSFDVPVSGVVQGNRSN